MSLLLMFHVIQLTNIFLLLQENLLLTCYIDCANVSDLTLHEAHVAIFL